MLETSYANAYGRVAESLSRPSGLGFGLADGMANAMSVGIFASEETYSLNASSSIYDEGDTAVFTLTTTDVPDGTVLQYSVSGLSSADVSGGQLGGSVTIFGNKAQLGVSLVADNTTEGAEALTVDILGTSASLTVKVNDTSQFASTHASFLLTAPASSIQEGQTAVFTLVTTGVPDGTVFQYALSGVSAADVSDGQLAGKFTVIGNKAQISVPLLDDKLSESGEVLAVSIIGNAAVASLLVQDNIANTTTTTYTLTALAASVNEGDTASFALTTTNLPDGSAVGYTLSGVSAGDVAGGLLAGTATIVGGKATITVPLLNDKLTEGTETLVVTLTGSVATASTQVIDTSRSIPPGGYTVTGTQGNDYLVPAAGNQYLGGGGNDAYLVNSSTLNSAVTAVVIDTEGTNVIQFTDGTVISASQFLSNAVQLTLSTGAVLQILGASAFKFQVGANAVAGDGAPVVSYADFADLLAVSLPTTGSVAGRADYLVPSSFTKAAAATPAVAGVTFNVPGTLGDDFMVPSAGDTYFGGGGNDAYLVSGNTFAGKVTAVILDVEGSNTIQLADGTTIASSLFLNDAVQLTLSTGATLQIPGASKFNYQVGANITAGDSAGTLGYGAFAAVLGATVPAAGGAAVHGTDNFVVPSSGATIIGPVPAMAAEVESSGRADATLIGVAAEAMGTLAH